ncbi:A1 cistron-splicing factor [Tricharina praecox]|uniref:A1 cistron-splicing factor n=1 Tax=Tricharina praecox TaxID=43433 RepID=UPI00221E53FE|nr:A1 cistron-splicing factor [Tricharina praecox]KAI5855435.1 A1 cistron-splicing factor [Tricharina praecox]
MSTSTIHIHTLPPSSHLGLDLSSLTTPSTFTGISSLPPGLHHIWISPAPSLTLRHGRWVLCAGDSDNDTHYFRYDAGSEGLVREDVEGTVVRSGASESESEAEEAEGEEGLISYRQRHPGSGSEGHSDSAWRALVAHVTPGVLTCLLGPGWAAETTSSSTSTSGDDEDDAADLAAGKAFEADSEVRIAFTAINLKTTWPAGAVGRERTEKARDRSWALSEVLGRQQELLGEWEVTFVVCLFLGNFAAGEQWQKVVRLVLTCREAVFGGSEGWFVEFLQGLRRMLEVLKGAGDGGGFLGDEVMAEVLKLLRGFGKVLREEEEEDDKRGRKVREEFLKLAGWASRKMDWVLDTREVLRKGMVQTEEGDMVEIQDEGLEEEEETGEYAPAVVEDLELSKSRSESPLEIQMADEEDDDPRF